MKIFFTLFITLIFGLLILSINDPVFLASGSDSLDISVTPNATSQSVALVLFFFSIIHGLKVKYKNEKLGVSLKAIFISIALIVLLSSGHTFTISGKQHAFVDKWFHIPLQTLAFDPTHSIESFTYQSSGMLVTIYEDKQIKQTIFTGPLFWGVNAKELTKKLDDFGFTNSL